MKSLSRTLRNIRRSIEDEDWKLESRRMQQEEDEKYVTEQEEKEQHEEQQNSN